MPSILHRLFGITPLQARRMDPNQRFLLEVGYDAIYRMGHTKATLRVAQPDCAVVVGHGESEWMYVASDRSSASARISYCLGMTGVAQTVDTGPSSSLTAVHNAVGAVRGMGNARSDMALALGVSLLLSHVPWVEFSTMRWLSRRGRCATFNAKADGFIKGEGCGAVLLKIMQEVGPDGTMHEPKDEGATLVGLLAGTRACASGKAANLTAPSASVTHQ
eukprot:2340716-Amphidinium_carterae.1